MKSLVVGLDNVKHTSVLVWGAE